MSNDLLVLTLIHDLAMRDFAHKVLGDEGHRVISARDCEEAQSMVKSINQPYLLLIESNKFHQGERNGYRQLLVDANANSTCLIVGAGEQQQSREARALGISRFLMKPFTRGDLESLINHAYSPSVGGFPPPQGPSKTEEMCGRTSRAPRKEPETPLIEELGSDRFFLAATPSMLEIYRQVKLLADVDVPVLILGESGTGKEVIAHLIHKYSRRSRQKFLNINCAALPMDLLESELFGHVKGAFTGAVSDKPGKFELADRGTLLLDEIGEMSPAMQAKLLHVLQDGQFTALGGRKSTKVDVHILAATNVSIDTALAERTFRQDLFYRLNTFTIKVPSLRERREEIPFMVAEMIRRTPDEMKSAGFRYFSPALMALLPLYDWPGNIRELRNFVTRTLVMKDETSAGIELEAKIARAGNSRQKERALEDVRNSAGMRSVVRDARDHTETRMIQDALEASGWNRRGAAESLNISYRSLLYKIQQYRLSSHSLSVRGDPRMT